MKLNNLEITILYLLNLQSSYNSKRIGKERLKFLIYYVELLSKEKYNKQILNCRFVRSNPYIQLINYTETLFDMVIKYEVIEI